MNVIGVPIGLALWVFLVSRRYSRPPERFTAGWLEAVTGLVVAALLWWAYVKTTDPSISTPVDLLRQGVDGYGGMLTTTTQSTYFALLGLAFFIGLLFVCVGWFICRKSGTFNVTQLSLRDVGLFYFVGMAAFLTAFVSAAVISGHAFGSYVLAIAAFVAVGLYTVQSQRIVPRVIEWIRTQGLTVLVMAPTIVFLLCLLQYVVPKRGGPGYDEFARFIVANNRIPLFNRHFGQSLLAGVLLFNVGSGHDMVAYSRVAVNNWLYISQIGFIFLIYRTLHAMGASWPGAAFGLIYVMLGNTALSWLPWIMYDHDYPLFLNIYADSLFGVAGFVILVSYLVSRVGVTLDTLAPKSWWWPSLIVPGLITMAFSYTAELNMLLSLAVVGLLLALALIDRRGGFDIPVKELVGVLVVSVCAIAAGATQGGIFAGRIASPEKKKDTPFLEASVASAGMTALNPRWWYLPVGLPGGLNPAEMGGLPCQLGDVCDSINDPLLNRFHRGVSGTAFRYIYLIQLVELRFFETLRLLWFPLVGLIALGWCVVSPRFSSRTRSESQRELAPVRLFWALATASFTIGLLVVFSTNSVGGNATFWKGALTRFFEPGLCLGMLALAIAVDRFLRLVPSRPWRYAAWTALAVATSFGALFRIFAFTGLNS